MIQENIYINLSYFILTFCFIFKLIFQILSYKVLIVFDKVRTGTYNFVSLIVMLLGLAFVLSLPAADKTQYFVHVSFNSILQLITGILKDLQKLLKYFNGTAIAAFFRTQLA